MATPSSATTDISATTTITFEQLTKYFHLPINDVAKELGICATMLKKICRKNGIPRWPHRKIKSLNKMIENLEASLQNNTSEAEECIRQEINILRNKKSLIMKNPSILVQGSSSKRQASDQDGKALKKIKPSEDDVPVATITIPKSSASHSSTNSLSINQLLTPNNPFSTPLTSYLLSNEEKDSDKDSSKEVDSQQLVARPASPSSMDGHNYYNKSVPSQQQQQTPPSPGRYYLPQSHSSALPNEYHRRTSVEFLTSTPFHQQAQQQPQSLPQDSHHSYVLPKINFSPNAPQPPSNSYLASSPPKFRPPSPITSSHQQGFSSPTPDNYSRHAPTPHFFHYHNQLPNPSGYGKMPQYPSSSSNTQPTMPQLPSQPTQPQLTQQYPPQHQLSQQQHIALAQQQQQQSPPMVLRWVMEYDKAGKK